MRYDNKTFSEKSNEIHNNKYDYSLVEYVNSKTKVKIICKEHGVFEQIPSGHLSGKGCIGCGYDSNKISGGSFIKRSNSVHNFEFDYSLVDYINSYTKVKIICKKHGVFEQTPNAHINGQKCKKCVIDNNTLTNSEFISKSNKVHKGKYDYSLVEYISNISDVIIVCPEHGEFKQRPSNHLSGSGCRKCHVESVHNDNYLEKCNDKFNHKYDYSLVGEYINNKSKVVIICPEHGEFKQSFKQHLKSSGCPYCSGKRTNTKFYIKRSNEVHNNKYDYSLVEYVHAHKKVTIICSDHGEFEQLAYIHVGGSGCPTCKSSKGEREISILLDGLGIKYDFQKKFEGCEYKSDLLFDFYIEELNLCLEYNGIQHYKPIDYFGGVDGFDLSKKRDEIKKEYCKSHKINLGIITYRDDIKQKLLKIIYKYNK